jgi:hypothetical protein
MYLIVAEIERTVLKIDEELGRWGQRDKRNKEKFRVHGANNKKLTYR